MGANAEELAACCARDAVQVTARRYLSSFRGHPHASIHGKGEGSLLAGLLYGPSAAWERMAPAVRCEWDAMLAQGFQTSRTCGGS